MNKETDDKIETIIISAVNRLYSKEESIGLDFEDLKCLEIIYKIKKEAKSTNNSPLSSPTRPENLVELLRAVRGITDDNSSSIK